MKIVAIGGGSVRERETDAIDRELISLAGAKRPKVLFIPTATEDSEEYALVIDEAYGSFGCDVSTLRLLSVDADPILAASKISAADLIYVGGGNTKMMLEVWRSLGVDKALRKHLDSGKPAGGVSAGAICWFAMGNSDWPVYEGIEGVNTAPIQGLGFVDLVLCPHTRDETHRLGEFREMLKEIGGVGLGLDDCCAIEIVDDQYRILATQSNSVAHLLGWKDGVLVERVLSAHDDFRALSDLTL